MKCLKFAGEPKISQSISCSTILNERKPSQLKAPTQWEKSFQSLQNNVRAKIVLTLFC